MRLEPAMQLRAGVPLVLGSSVDVIESQELDVVIAAARACRVAIAVVHQSGHAIALLCSSALHSLCFGIVPHELPARKYLAAFARPLETLACRAGDITMKIVRRQRQLFPAHRTDSCWQRGQSHWCNPFRCSVTSIIAELRQGVKGG